MHPRSSSSLLAVVVSLGLFSAGLSACEDAPTAPACADGTEGCACSSGRFCDPGLICASGLCVMLPAGPDASEPAPDASPDVTLADASPAEDVAADVSPATDAAPPADTAPPTCEARPTPDFCACDDNADCASGHCVPSSDGGAICTTACDDTCPDGFDCRFVTLPVGDPTYLCVERDLNLCRPCTEDAECQRDAVDSAGARCVRYSAARGSFCGLGCDTDADCPGAYACREAEVHATGDRVRQCVLADPEADCACSGRSIAASAATDCAIDRCDGTRRCEASGLTVCEDAAGLACAPSVAVSVTFDPQGGALVGPVTRAVWLGEPYGALPEATRTGHDLLGWRTAPFGGAEVLATTLVATREAHTLFAAWEARRYLVTFDAAGGSPCEPRTVTWGAAYGASGPLCTPSRVGYTFSGWRLASGGDEPITAETLVTTASNHVLTAGWLANTYRVTFDSEGGSACAARAVTFASTYGAAGPLCVPTRPGYVFGGWFQGDNGAGDVVTSASVVATPDDHTLHAAWTAATFTVTFEPAGGLASSPASRSVTFGEPYGPLATTARTGYAFTGWWTVASTGGAEVTPASIVATPTNHTLYARWDGLRYTLRFDSEGGTPCDSRTVTFGAPYAAGGGALCAPTRTGHTFDGWSLGDDGTGEAISDATVVATPNNHTIHARWSANRYTVTFDSEGGTPCDSLAVTYRQPYGPLCAPTRTGHTFAGWYDGDNGTGAEITAATVMLAGGNHTLFARWILNSYTVRFDSEGGSACTPRTVTFGAAYGTLGNLCTPLRPGYAFGGWYDGDNGTGRAITAATLLAIAADHTLYARWSPAVLTVTPDLGGGAGCGAFPVVYGEPYGAAGELCVPTRSGYTFAGWFSARGESGAAVTATTLVTAVADHALFARWTAIALTVTLDPRGGAGCPATLAATFGDSYGAASGGSLCAPTRFGYTFAGWWTAESAGVEVTSATIIATPGPHTLSARWTPTVWTVTFDAAGGVGCTLLSVSFGAAYGASTAGALCVPTRPGYTFGGWFLGATTVTAATVVTTAADHTLVARWGAESTTVTYDNAGGAGCTTLTVSFGAPYGAVAGGLLCAPTRTGYTFGGWAQPDGVIATAATAVTTPGPHTLTARWTGNRYAVAYEVAGGSACDGLNVTFGAPYGPLCVTSRAGYIFAGWHLGVGGTGASVTAATAVATAADHVLHARWAGLTATVTYDNAGGGGCSALTVTFGQPYGAAAPGGALCAPSREGHAFLGWYASEDPAAPLLTGATAVATAGDHRLVARWELLSQVVTYDNAGGSGCATLAVGFGTRYGRAAPGGLLCVPVRPGYTFTGWWTGAGGTGTAITADTLVFVATNHSLFATWTANSYAVTFDAAAGTEPTPPGKVVTFAGLYGDLATTARVGYTFAGWFTGPDGAGVEVTAQTEVTRPEAHTLYARWTANTYQLSFDTAGGAACPARPVTFGAAYGALCAPTRPGYTFAGWRASADASAPPVTADDLVTTAADHALHARWTVNTYAVAYDSEGGSACEGFQATFDATYGAAAPGGALCVPTRATFVFGGWFLGDNGTGEAVTAASVVATPRDHTLFARWAPSGMPTFVRVAAGTYTTGSPAAEAGRDGFEDRIDATLTRDFLLSETEITQGQWKAAAGGANPTSAAACGDSCPVDQVSWWSALGYANALSTSAGLTPCYTLPATKPDGTACTGTWQAGTLDCGPTWPVLAADTVQACDGFRLPTEAEWEYAARAGTTTATWLGDLSGNLSDCTVRQPNLDSIAWWVCNADALRPVRGRAANPWGLFDMLGNVPEWTWDAYDGARVEGGTDPSRTTVPRFDASIVGASNRAARRVVRGGGSAWNNGVWRIPRAALREARDATTTGRAGLRLARTLPGQLRPKMVRLNPGVLTVGSPSSEAGRQTNEAQASATLTRAFELAETELTQGQWKALSGGVNPSYFQTADCTANACASTENANDAAPVEGVSWWSALGYLNALSAASGLPACYTLPTARPDGSACTGSWQAGTLDCGAQWPTVTGGNAYACTGFRLPTEAEWELAARAGTTSATGRGELTGTWWHCTTAQAALDPVAWWCGNATDRTRTVKTRAANGWDLHDLLGNVWEWTWDAHDAAGAAGGTDPQRTTAAAAQRVRRGGGWSDGGWLTRMASRAGEAPSGGRDPAVGLRPARLSPNQELWVTVTYDSQGGSACPSVPASVGGTYGALGALCAPTKAGDAFGGWWTAASGGTQVTAATTVTSTSNHTLFARWATPAGFVTVKLGTFTMGSPSGEVGRESDEGQVSVTLTRAFWISETEVTQGQWKARSGGTNPSEFSGCGDSCPVEQVSWWSVFGYANALSQAEGLAACYTLPTTKPDGTACTGTWQAGTLDCGDRMPTVNGGNVYACTGYRLPTEAEWEYAARAGTTTATYGGNLSGTSGCVTLSGAGAFPSGTQLANLGWYSCNSGATRAVKGKSPNAWGLYDMLGNVWEWTWDRKGSTSGAGGTDPQLTAAGPLLRVFRGGGSGQDAGYLRAASRSGNTPGSRYNYIGFRISRSVPRSLNLNP
jgi:uncharacterized repeat protein (TIGR02543 family)